MATRNSRRLDKPTGTGIPLLAATMACSLAGGLPAASAQTAASGVPEATLEEIVVTARKREEPLQEVPIAISVFSRESIEAGNLNRVVDFVDLIPNATYTQDGNTSSEISIRGSGRNISDEDPGVGLYRDGVYVGGLLFSTANFYDIAQVEILRGPQGGLYGRNAVGGSMNVASERPGNEWGGYVDVQLGSKDRQEYRVAANLPIVEDRWALRVAGLYIDQDEGFDYIVNQDRYSDAVDNRSVRLRSLFTPNANWEFLTTLETLDVEGGAELTVLAPDADTGYLDADATIPYPGTRPADTTRQERDTPEFRKLKQQHAIQEVNWTLPQGTATAIVSYRSAEFDSLRDEDLTIHDISSIGYDASQDSLFAELRFASADLGGFKFTTGVSYLNEDVALNFENEIGSNFAGALPGHPSIAALYAAGVVTDEWAPIFGAPVGTPISALGLTPFATGWHGYLGDTFPTDFINEQDLDSIAVFVEADYDLTDAVRLWGNLRYTHDAKSIDFAQTFGIPSRCPVACPEVFALFFGGLDPVIEASDSETFTNVSPGGGVDWRVSDHALVYAKVVTGFKAGGFNSTAGCTDNLPFDEETTLGYEVGAKTDWLDQRLRVNVAAFHQTRSDALVTINDPCMEINTLGVNAGEIENRGVELEIGAEPLPGLRVEVAAGYLDSTFTDFVIPDPDGAGPRTDLDFNGNQVPRTFKYTLAAVGSYSRPLTESFGLALRASYRNGWDGYTNNDNVEEMSQPEVTDLRIGLESEAWRVTAYCDNLFDNRYTTSEFASATTSSRHFGTFSPGRTYGLQGVYRF